MTLHKTRRLWGKQTGNRNITEYKKACKLKTVEGKALHKPDLREAKYAYKNTVEYNKASKLKRVEGRTLHKPDFREAKYACKKIAEYNKACKLGESRE